MIMKRDDPKGDDHEEADMTTLEEGCGGLCPEWSYPRSSRIAAWGRSTPS
jgi:hypothetical protein